MARSFCWWMIKVIRRQGHSGVCPFWVAHPQIGRDGRKLGLMVARRQKAGLWQYGRLVPGERRRERTPQADHHEGALDCRESRLVAGRVPFAIRNLGHGSRCERALGNLGGWNGLASLASRLETDRPTVLWEVDGRWEVLCLRVTRPSLGIAAKGKSLRL